MIDDRVLPNPFLTTDTDLLLAALERRLAGVQPQFLDRKFLSGLKYATLRAIDNDPSRRDQGMRIIARLRELR